MSTAPTDKEIQYETISLQDVLDCYRNRVGVVSMAKTFPRSFGGTEGTPQTSPHPHPDYPRFPYVAPLDPCGFYVCSQLANNTTKHFLHISVDNFQVVIDQSNDTAIVRVRPGEDRAWRAWTKSSIFRVSLPVGRLQDEINRNF